LDEHRAGELFWNGIAESETGRSHIGLVRTRIDHFQQRIGATEAARQALLDRIECEEEAGEYIADDLDGLQRRAKERKREWVIEREESRSTDRQVVMPWTRGREDDRRFRKLLVLALLLSLVFGVLLPLVPLPVRDRLDPVDVPERLTRLIEERQSAPLPMPERLREPAEAEQAAAEKLVAEESATEAVEQKAEPSPGTGAKGILAFREQFSSLTSGATTRLGSAARVTRAGELATGRASRSLVAIEGSGSSGGIDISTLSRNVAGGGGKDMAGVQVAQATSAIGAVGGGNDRPLSGGPGASRTDEEIQIVFDRHKASLYRLYNRELRRNPTLQGQIVLRMTIEADGSVSLCEVQSSTMKAPELGAQVVERVKLFDFGAKEGIAPITILYPIDFLPAA
jgi:TonB family protein